MKRAKSSVSCEEGSSESVKREDRIQMRKTCMRIEDAIDDENKSASAGTLYNVTSVI